MTIRLLVADDHEWIRDGLRLAFLCTEKYIVTEAVNREEAVCLALAMDIDMVLLDFNMTGGDGIEALTRIRSAKSDLPILMYSAQGGLDCTCHSREACANGLLRMGVDNKELIDTVRLVAAGGICWTHFPSRLCPAK